MEARKKMLLTPILSFGKTAMGNQAFRFKRYEDAVANVAVTHSPRYAIDMDIAPGETFLINQDLPINRSLNLKTPLG
ncbi:MAG: hypothetical protein ACLU38_13450 [Dysosmobacter sp.]